MRLNSSALYRWLTEEGHQPDYMEEETEITICCPLCKDDRARLYVSCESGAWTCFHCHESGNLHQFLMRCMELDGSDAFDVGRHFRMSDDGEQRDYFEVREREVEPKPVEILTLPQSFRPITQDSPDIFKNYLGRRGVSVELAASRGIGYSLSGRYAYRVILPVQNDGMLYTFVARSVLQACPNCQEKIDDCTCRPYKFPKVLTPTSKLGARPSYTLYNLDAVRRTKPSPPIVVEGAFDALRLPNRAVGLLGSSASTTQLTLLAGLARPSGIILCLDGDTAGYKGTLKIAEALASEMIKVKVALLPDGRDPGSLNIYDLEQCLEAAKPYIL